MNQTEFMSGIFQKICENQRG